MDYHWSNRENNEKVVGSGFGLEKGSIWKGRGSASELGSHKGNMADSRSKPREDSGPLGVHGKKGIKLSTHSEVRF